LKQWRRLVSGVGGEETVGGDGSVGRAGGISGHVDVTTVGGIGGDGRGDETVGGVR